MKAPKCKREADFSKQIAATLLFHQSDGRRLECGVTNRTAADSNGIRHAPTRSCAVHMIAEPGLQACPANRRERSTASQSRESAAKPCRLQVFLRHVFGEDLEHYAIFDPELDHPKGAAR